MQWLFLVQVWFVRKQKKNSAVLDPDWKRRLGLHLWYESENGALGPALAAYDAAVSNESATEPRDLGRGDFSATYRLLQLASMDEGYSQC